MPTALRSNRVIFAVFTISTFLLGGACDNNRPEPLTMHLIETVDLALDEPSGLSLSDNPNQLMVVSDDDNRIYRLNLDGTAQALSFSGDDLEGITQNLADRSIWVVEEEASRLLHLDLNGNPIDTFPISFNPLEVNHGMEGVSVDPAAERIYIVTEKSPALLLVLDFQGQILAQHSLTFAEDNSGISYAPEENSLYILSDQSAWISQCDLQGQRIESYPIPVNKAEGLAVDIPRNRFYVVSDENSQLYIFERR
jgi:uncharacterized protein YjiK